MGGAIFGGSTVITLFVLFVLRILQVPFYSTFILYQLYEETLPFDVKLTIEKPIFLIINNFFPIMNMIFFEMHNGIAWRIGQVGRGRAPRNVVGIIY